jgi:hypothetical protein
MSHDFTAGNELEASLVRATTDAGARAEFYRRLLASELFFLTPEAPPQEPTRVTGEREPVEIVCWEGPNGSFLPFFSSRERMAEVISEGGAPLGRTSTPGTLGQVVPNYGFICVLGRDAFALLAEDPAEAVLNPGLPHAKPFSIEEIRAIADGSILRGESITIEPSADVLLGQPAVYPAALAEALGALFARYPAVEAAFLAQIHDPKSGLPAHPIIGVVGFGCGDAVQEAGAVASGVVQGPVDFVEIDPGEDQGIAGYLRRDAAPFYLRKTPAAAAAPLPSGS